MNFAFDARKRIYRLEESESWRARLLLGVLLAAFRALDRLILKRARKPDLKSEKLISDDRKFVCVLTPKVASRTLLDGLRAAGERQQFDVRIAECSLADLRQQIEGYYAFTVVRDPWARCYSCYKQKILQHTPIKGALHFTGRAGLHPGMSFEEFVRWLSSNEGSDELADRHWMSQYRILGLDEGMSYNHIGKLETLDLDLAVVAEQIGIDTSHFGHRLKTSEAGGHLRHFTPELIEQVGQRYRRDVETFGYQYPSVEG